MPEPGSKLGLAQGAACGIRPIPRIAASAAMVFTRYLALPPGWRFVIGADGYEDVWYDASLLATESL